MQVGFVNSSSNSSSLQDLKPIEDFLMHLNQENMQFSSIHKLNQIYKLLSAKMISKLKVTKLCFAYIANYIMLKRMTFPISKEAVGCIEKLVMDHLPTFCFGVNIDYEYMFFILIICYEIYIYAVHHFVVADIFSEKFLKFLRNLSFLFQEKTWKHLYQVLSAQTLKLNSYLSYSNPSNKSIKYSSNVLKKSTTSLNKSVDFSQKNYNDSQQSSAGLHNSFAKVVISSSRDCLLCLMHISFYLLQQPHDTILSNFIFVNQEESKLPISEIMHLSSFMEKTIADVYKTQGPLRTTIKFKLQTRKSEKIKLLFEKVFPFFSLKDKKQIISLVLLNKRYSRFLIKCLYKKVLKEKSEISKENRIRIYRKLIILNAESFYDSIRLSKHHKIQIDIEDSTCYLNTIKKDVFRTKFFKGDQAELEKLLNEVAQFIPSMGYFQGLNCIGAFMLDYTKDYLISYDILSFLMHKQMNKYFMGDFQFLNKLIYIGEKLIQKHHPIVHDMLSQSDIGHEFYMSAIIVTIYFNTLQFSKNYFFILNSLDLFFSEGWIGFYKVFG